MTTCPALNYQVASRTIIRSYLFGNSPKKCEPNQEKYTGLSSQTCTVRYSPDRFTFIAS